jgi:hypothetical protein
MPLSDVWHVPAVMHFVRAVAPMRVLDVGIGMGNFGLLVRQYGDVSNERLSREQWKLRIDGIELFEPYRNPVWAYAYDQVLMGDARQIVPTLSGYDLVLLNDVLEHFERSDARELIRDCLRAGRVVLATTPNCDYPQGAWGGNEAETHRCLITADDFEDLAEEMPVGCTTLYACSNSADVRGVLERAAQTCPRFSGGPRGIVRRAAGKMKKLLSR